MPEEKDRSEPPEGSTPILTVQRVPAENPEAIGLFVDCKGSTFKDPFHWGGVLGTVALQIAHASCEAGVDVTHPEHGTIDATYEMILDRVIEGFNDVVGDDPPKADEASDARTEALRAEIRDKLDCDPHAEERCAATRDADESVLDERRQAVAADIVQMMHEAKLGFVLCLFEPERDAHHIAFLSNASREEARAVLEAALERLDTMEERAVPAAVPPKERQH